MKWTSGIMAVEDKRGSLSRHHRSFDTLNDDESIFPGSRLTGSQSPSSLGQSIFDYVEKQSAKSPIFYNFCYSVDSDSTVLRPYCGVSKLELWDYYLTEELSHGLFQHLFFFFSPSFNWVSSTFKNTLR